ncbi:hypothetical protein HanRHA438_Chr02g0052291 [Helianthus annuus]|nr:hypothetical protein HanRHA438_Chr02g0052291 [Helianthus annuus]
MFWFKKSVNQSPKDPKQQPISKLNIQDLKKIGAVQRPRFESGQQPSRSSMFLGLRKYCLRDMVFLYVFV